LLAIAPIYLVTFVFLVVPNNQRFPTVILSTFVFSLLQLVFPLCRPVRATPLCPLNWVTAAFCVQLVVMPLYINLVGPAAGTLPRLPSDQSINWAILLSVLSYASFCVAYQTSGHLLARLDPTAASAPAGERVGWTAPRTMIAAYALLGVVGVYFAFGGLSELLQYFSQPAQDALVPSEQPATLTGAASSFLRPFLGFAFALLWCRWVDRRQGPRLPRLLGAPVVIIIIMGSYYSFNYNRGAVIAPMVALAAVYSTRVRQVPTAALVLVAMISFPLVMVLGVYRTGGTTLGDVVSDPSARRSIGQELNLDETVQVYGGAPQFTAFALESSDYARHLYWGTTLAASAILPVPVLGKPFRSYSGVTIYNQMIYGNITTLEGDQIFPFAAELFFNLHVFGVVAGYAALGVVIWRLQHAFEHAPNAIETFIWQYAGVWATFLVQGSLAVLSQILIYFFWPIYVYYVLRFIHSRCLPRQPSRGWVFDRQAAFARPRASKRGSAT
jgi:hypothetical protein